MRIAAIDLGSNSFHMLVAEIRPPDTFEIVLQEKMMIQIGRTAFKAGRLDKRAMERGLKCLQEFRQMALGRGVERTLAVATSAVRESENGEEFLRRVRTESRIPVRVISGREEARLIHTAVCRHVNVGARKVLIVDIGGGSVEFLVGTAQKLHLVSSQKLGFLRLQSQFIKGDPITRREQRTLKAFLTDTLSPLGVAIRKHNPELVIATSGTATTLLEVAQKRRNGNRWSSHVVSSGEIFSILNATAYLPSDDRAAKLDLDSVRSESFPAALLCLSTVLDQVGASEVLICPAALREGLIYDFIQKNKPQICAFGEHSGDPDNKAVLDLALRCSYPQEHSMHVAMLSEQMFQQTAPLHGLGKSEACLLRYAGILHDIGYHIGYHKHHKHGDYLIMHGDLRGVSFEDRDIIAQVVRYHRRATPGASHPRFTELPGRSRKIIKCLSAILRIADSLDRSHFSLVRAVRCRIRARRVVFELITDATGAEIDLDLSSAKQNAAYFEKVFDVETSFVTVRHSNPKRLESNLPHSTSEPSSDRLRSTLAR
jgi:exopolyphosphatase/guanosine-5'-triphosphate,3'-diphosphate pyrophosphatase